jgi:hypothetical protein
MTPACVHSANLPAAHSTQSTTASEPAGAVLPAGQSVHVAEPAAAYLPAPHVTQSTTASEPAGAVLPDTRNIYRDYSCTD